MKEMRSWNNLDGKNLSIELEGGVENLARAAEMREMGILGTAEESRVGPKNCTFRG